MHFVVISPIDIGTRFKYIPPWIRRRQAHLHRCLLKWWLATVLISLS
jgi:hypothetical protein